MMSTKKRLPKPFDSTRTIFFPVSSIDDKGFSYDILSNQLTIYAGSSYDMSLLSSSVDTNTHDKEILSKGFPLIILNNMDVLTYKASNVYGTEVSVERSFLIFYCLNILNIKSFSSKFYDEQSKRFFVQLQLPPKEAEKLSQSAEIVIGVHLLDDKESINNHCTCTSSKPTIDTPYELASFLNSINAVLVKVILRNKRTGEIISQYDIPETSATPAK